MRSEMRIEMQSQQSELLALGQELIRDYGRINKADDEAGIERNAKNLALVTKAVQGGYKLISRSGETEMDDRDTTPPPFSAPKSARLDMKPGSLRSGLNSLISQLECVPTWQSKLDQWMNQHLMSDEELDWFDHWGTQAHPHQTPLEGDWMSWLLLGGRGSGKTRAGAE